MIVPRTAISQALAQAQKAHDQVAVEAAKRLLRLIDESPTEYLACFKDEA